MYAIISDCKLLKLKTLDFGTSFVRNVLGKKPNNDVAMCTFFQHELLAGIKYMI